MQRGVVVDALAGIHWDLGSIPRSAQYVSIVFHNVIACRLHKGVPPCTSNNQAPCGHHHQSNGQEMDDHGVHKSTLRWTIRKVRKA